jgi:hypothetical protein
LIVLVALDNFCLTLFRRFLSVGFLTYVIFF